MLGRRLFPILLLGCVLPLQAQVYTWVDANGQKHFSNQPPPAQAVQEVKINQGYVSDGPPPAPAGSISETSTAVKEKAGGSADEKMCSEAMRWTAIDLPNLKDIARERKQEGKLTTAQYNQVIDAMDQAKGEITLKNCLASTGVDRKRYECLSGGAGIMVCSGALENALK